MYYSNLSTFSDEKNIQKSDEDEVGTPTFKDRSHGKSGVPISAFNDSFMSPKQKNVTSPGGKPSSFKRTQSSPDKQSPNRLLTSA